jgi:putative NADPH-quinone reductase
MKCLVLIAHPLHDSLCHALAQHAISTLIAHGHDVVVEDLHAAAFDGGATEPYARRLLDADALILVFPTWWFGFPAMLKGWFDRVWAPGVAYDHASDLGPIKARLDKLRRAVAITTLGSPWWVDRFVLRQPVKRILKLALLGTCAPGCRFEMLSLYQAESLSPDKVNAFRARIGRALKVMS